MGAASIRASAAASVPGPRGAGEPVAPGAPVLVQVLGEVGEEGEVAEGADHVQRVAVRRARRGGRRVRGGRRRRGAGAAPRPASLDRPKTASPAWSRITSPSTRPSSRMSVRSSSCVSAAAACTAPEAIPRAGDVDHAGSIPARRGDRNGWRPAFSYGSRVRGALGGGNGRLATHARSLASWRRPASCCGPGGCCPTCWWRCWWSR